MVTGFFHNYRSELDLSDPERPSAQAEHPTTQSDHPGVQTSQPGIQAERPGMQELMVDVDELAAERDEERRERSMRRYGIRRHPATTDIRRFFSLISRTSESCDNNNNSDVHFCNKGCCYVVLEMCMVREHLNIQEKVSQQVPFITSYIYMMIWEQIVLRKCTPIRGCSLVIPFKIRYRYYCII